jgi:cellulose synthase/poly-beta-1,6-N-acetylglucosamine synthase-like glycosyltransferase
LRSRGLVHIVHSTQLRAGKAAATNLAVKSSTGDIIINIDCDCTLDRFAFETICRPFVEPRIGAVAGNIVVRNAKASFITGYQSLEYLVILSLGKRGNNIADTVVCASGAFSAFRKTALESVLGLDAGGGEDLDLTLRLRKAGWGVRFSPESICYTDVPDTMTAFIRQRFRWERDAIRIRFRKHRDQVAPMSSRLQALELLHQLEYLIFDVGAAIAMPFYLVWLYSTYGDTATAILVAAQLGMFVLDILTLCLAALTMSQVLSMRHLLYMPAYSVMNSYFMRFVRLAAYFEEWVFEASYADSYVPAKVHRQRH